MLRKQNSVTKSYERKARKADVKYNGHDPNDESDGPIVVHLKTFGRVLGLAAGPHDVSPDFKAYIKRLAAKAGAKRWRTLGARSAREATALYYSTPHVSGHTLHRHGLVSDHHGHHHRHRHCHAHNHAGC